MFNAYAIIIGLFIVSGFIATLWGWLLIARARKKMHWPAVTGRIEVSEPASAEDDLLPHIEYSYTVQDVNYRKTLEFPGGTTPTPEFAASYVENYPAGASVRVYYDPQQPEYATLERGVQGGDWLVLVFGLVTVVMGLAMLL
ncbi:MAG: DUF3592 domain-containing protein [Gammaproteobacteria bacterium]